MNWVTIALLMKFLCWPIICTGVLFVLEVRESSIGSPFLLRAFLTKASLALSAYGLGSIIPFFHSDDLLFLRLGLISPPGAASTVTFDSEAIKRRREGAKALVWVVFGVGFVIWFANLALADRLGSLPFPLLSNWLWVSGFFYLLITAGIYTYTRTAGPVPAEETKDDKDVKR